MASFQIVVRGHSGVTRYHALATSSSAAFAAAADAMGDEPCGITVIPCEITK